MLGQIGFLYGCDCCVRMDGFVQNWRLGLGGDKILYREVFRANKATDSTCVVWGNMSTGWTDLTS